MSSVIVRRWLELLGSMRLAITLLVSIALASVIGTLIPQGEPYVNYQFQFGDFWFKQFLFLGLFDIYHTTWFIFLLGLLLSSTSICVYRYTPSMLRSIKHWRPASAYSVLQNMPYTFSIATSEENINPVIEEVIHSFGKLGQKKILPQGGSVIRWGSGYRLGYICTHVGIIFICLGGVLDSNLWFKWQQLTGQLVPEKRDITADQIPAKSRLNINNPSYRAQVNLPEGSSATFAFQNFEDGYLLQPLPLTLKLDAFHVEYHETGQPKAFISDISVKLPDGSIKKQSVQVNKPFEWGSLSIYQSSFGDGGTGFAVRAAPLFQTDSLTLPSIVRVFGKYKLNNQYTLEINDYKPINVEANPNKIKPEKEEKWKSFFSAVPKDRSSKVINLGATWTYRIRDAQGQAKEYHNYLEPISIEGRWYVLSGIREEADKPFRYFRMPLTPQGYLEPYFLWRLYWLNPEKWHALSEKFANNQKKSPLTNVDTISKMGEAVLSLFAKGGYEQVATFLEKSVPKQEQQKIADLYIKILDQLSLQSYSDFYEEFPAWRNKMPAPNTPEAAFFIKDSILSISDSFFYGLPYYLQVMHIDPVQSSGFQVTRSPGKPVVYFGCFLLVMGVFLLFYWREIRLWCWYSQGKINLAMNSNRLDSITERRFKEICAAVEKAIHKKLK
ncbi:MAG: cytochrome c biogenesis protein ResB [Pseudomonadota bacterium]